MSRYNHSDRMNSYSQYSFSSNDNRGRRQYNDRNAEEPEWFSGGPTSQNDTIELRGFEDYTNRQDSPSPRNSGDGDDDKAEYESDGEKANEETDKSNDNNNNDNKNGGGGGGGDEASNRDTNTEKSSDYEPEDIEVANAEPKSNKKDDNFNIEDFLKVENLTDFLTVSHLIL